jgi:hypothetical protein|tara:strand:+ start:1106 stop:1507 length:402 start_codon:yes stop_codon:yes gene_type:complete
MITAPSDRNELKAVGILREFYPGIRWIWKNTLCRVDAYSVTDNVIIEIKTRTKHYDSLLLEYEKLDSLQQIARDLDMQSLYAVETPRGLWYWNVTDLSPAWDVLQLPYSTVDNKPNINKRVTFLHTANGIQVF